MILMTTEHATKYAPTERNTESEICPKRSGNPQQFMRRGGFQRAKSGGGKLLQVPLYWYSTCFL